MGTRRTDPYTTLFNTAKTTRMLAKFLLVVGALIAALLLLMWLLAAEMSLIWMVAFVLAFYYVIPGVVLLLLAGGIENANQGAVVGTLIIALLMTVGFGVDVVAKLLGDKGPKPLLVLMSGMPLLLSVVLVFQTIKALRVTR